MIPIAQKMIYIEREIAAERPGIALFALLERTESAGKWDLIVGADWVIKDERAARSYVIGKLQKALTKQELISLSRVVVLPSNEPFVRALNSYTPVDANQVASFGHTFLGGMEIDQAYIITSRELPPLKTDPEKMIEAERTALKELYALGAELESKPVRRPRTTLRLRSRGAMKPTG